MKDLLTVEEAQARALEVVRRVGAERVAVRGARGRVLAEEVRAPEDVPREDNSAMDGFAVRAADGAVELTIVDESRAGHPASRALSSGEAIRIMTGATIPAGADAVVMVEHTTSENGRVRLSRAVAVGENLRRAGEDVRAGEVVLAPGVTLGPAELGVLASARRATVQVARKPQVAILSTGDELRDVDEPLAPGAIAETNSYALATLVEEAGGIALVAPFVRDNPARVRAALEEARAADLIVTSGGVSVGEHDHVRAVLDEMGAQLSFWRVDMKPGKPVAVARLGETPVYGLPGNPVSSMVAFLLFVRPALRRALGCAMPFDLPRATAILDGALKTRGDRRQYLRARLRFDDDGRLRAAPMGRQGSHVLTSMVGASGLIVVEKGPVALDDGARVTVLIIGALA